MNPNSPLVPSFSRVGLAGLLVGLVIIFSVVRMHAQEWTGPVRGSWVRADSTPQPGDIVLVEPKGSNCEIVVAPGESTAVQQAARFLAGDIEAITGFRPPIVTAASGQPVAIHLATLASGGTPASTPALPAGVRADALKNQWEAYQVLTADRAVWLIGSNFRGTAFASYTLSERLGIDPLYLWTGYKPAHHDRLVLARTDFFSGPPTFRYRGFFHDDEDVLPRPFDELGYPLQTGTVPQVWYERFFETALRLRLNMVAPYVRVQRPFEVQKLASDWGLIYTSHHYDILLSNPWGFTRFGLARARGAGEQWDWFKNREGMLNFWRGGVTENAALDCIWPVGLRDTQDSAYKFPPGMSDDEKLKVFRDVIDAQIALTRSALPKDREPVFDFTLYTEMLALYQQGRLNLPSNVIVVWTDDNDGTMRALPRGPDQWKHGVYYHLAYYTRYTYPTKQVTHTVAPLRISGEFGKIVEAGATEYMLVNVTEVRDFAMEARMIAEITHDAKHALTGPDSADRYISWWSREYFSPAADEVAAAYHSFYTLLDSADKIWSGSERIDQALAGLRARAAHRRVVALEPPDALDTLRAREKAYRAVFDQLDRANTKLAPDQQRYLFENLTLGLLIDYRPTRAALLLAEAMNEYDDQKVRALCFQALDELKQLETEIHRAERPPFEGWYRKTWIKSDDSPSNVHRPYEHLQAFLIEQYLKP